MRFALASVSHPALPQRLRACARRVLPLETVLTGGLAPGCVHEFYARETDDASAVAGFVIGLALPMAAGRTILWLRPRHAARRGGILQASGWAELGGSPGACLFALLADDKALLHAALEGVRCAALGAVVVESWGRIRELDLTASRRLALAAEKSGVPLFLLRVDAQPVPSAAQTRWQVAAAPSCALPGNAPGLPAFDIELLRQRGGSTGGRWRLEWDRERSIFREATLSGAVVSVPARRPAAEGGARHAA